MSIHAIACFDNAWVRGTVEFKEAGKNGVTITASFESPTLKNSVHGIHIHEAGDLTDECMGACAHFNPYNKVHGGPGSAERHVGDLGNIRFDSRGHARLTLSDKLVKLRGTRANVIGRSVVLHADPDDLGQGANAESLRTGNAGKRIACAVIGYSKAMFSPKRARHTRVKIRVADAQRR